MHEHLSIFIFNFLLNISKKIQAVICYIVVVIGGMFDYRLLAKMTGSDLSIYVAYIVFLTKLQNGKPCEMDLPLLKYDIKNLLYI